MDNLNLQKARELKEQARRARESRQRMHNFVTCMTGANIIAPSEVLEQAERKVVEDLMAETALVNCEKAIELLSPKQVVNVLLLLGGKNLKQVELMKLSNELNSLNDDVLLWAAEHPEIKGTAEDLREGLHNFLNIDDESSI